MSKKKDTEIEIVDTETGAEIRTGKKKIAQITEENGQFIVIMSEKEIAVARTFPDAVEEAIKAYNLNA